MVQEVIHHHEGGGNGGGMQNLLIGLVLVVVVFYLFLTFGLPAIRQSVPSTNIDVPEQIDVTVTQE